MCNINPLNRKQKRAASIFSAISGRGGTGVDLRWYPAKEFRELSDAQKDELMTCHNSDEEKAVIADGRAKAKAKPAKLSEGGKKKKMVVASRTPRATKSTKIMLKRQPRNC